MLELNLLFKFTNVKEKIEIKNVRKCSRKYCTINYPTKISKHYFTANDMEDNCCNIRDKLMIEHLSRV